MVLRRSIVVILVPLFVACSAVQATKGPESKDFSVLDIGTPRYKVLAEFEQPIATETTKDGRKYDIYKFYQGL